MVSGDPDGEPVQEMILRRAGDIVSLCILCLVVGEIKDGNLKTVDGFPHSPMIPTFFKKDEVVVQSECRSLGNAKQLRCEGQASCEGAEVQSQGEEGSEKRGMGAALI